MVCDPLISCEMDLISIRIYVISINSITMNSVDKSDIQYARQQLEEAERRLESVIERASRSEDVPMPASRMDDVPEVVEDEVYEVSQPVPDQDAIQGHIQNIIMDCQFCIEISVKSMFKIVGKDFPRSHSIELSDGKTKGLYHEAPDSFSRKDDIIRAIFLTQFWSNFYELAKYGAPNMNVQPSSIFDWEDGERAIDDTIYCLELALGLLEHVEECEVDS